VPFELRSVVRRIVFFFAAFFFAAMSVSWSFSVACESSQSDQSARNLTLTRDQVNERTVRPRC